MDDIHYLEPSQIHAIIDAVPSVSKYPERDMLLLEVMWQTGARVGEATTLLPEHVGTTSIVLKNLKQRKRIRTSDGTYLKIHDVNAIKEVEVSEELCLKVKDYCREHELQTGQWVFPSNRTKSKPLARWYVWDMLNKASEHAQVFVFGKKNPTTGGKFKGAYPHMFRHSCAVHLLDKTDNVELVRIHLGHSRITTTQGYAHIKPDKVRKTIKNIEW